MVNTFVVVQAEETPYMSHLHKQMGQLIGFGTYRICIKSLLTLKAPRKNASGNVVC